MPSTPTHGLRWPLSTATPDVPRDLQNLAEDTDTALTVVQEATGNHARGAFPGQVHPSGLERRLTASLTAASGVTEAGDVFTLTAPGYYAVAAEVSVGGGAGIPEGVRAFVHILEGSGKLWRANIDNDNRQAVSAVIHSTGTTTVEFIIFQLTGEDRTWSGSFNIKHLGEGN